MTRPSTGVADPDGPAGPIDEHQSTDDSARLSSSDPGTGGAPWRWQPIDAVVAVFYLALGYFVTSHLWKSPSSLAPPSNPNDPTFFEWMLVHAVRIFSHGENPFFTSQLNAPLGVNLMSNTSMLGITVPFAPLTALIGPAPVFVLIIMLGLAGTACAWYYVLARHFVGNRLGAFVGAAFCGFGPGIMTHANAHPNIVSQFVLPFIVLRALMLRKTTRPVRDGVILGLLIAYQAFINEELLFLTALSATIFVLVYAMFRPRVLRDASTMLVGLASTGVTALVLLAYPLWYQFKGPQSFSGLPKMLDSYPYWLPLNSFVTLPSLSPWGVPYGQPGAFPTGTEENSFFGWTLLIVVVAIIVVLWKRRPAVRALAVVGALFAWGSMGGRISVTGTGTSYPFSLWRHVGKLPLVDSVLPSRLALVLVPVIGILLAFAVADAYRAVAATADQDGSVWTAAFASVALTAIVIALVRVVPTPVPATPRGPVPYFFTSGAWRPYVPAGYSVLSATPYEETTYMRWAIAGNLDFSVAGGYFLGPAPLTAGQTTPIGQYGPQWRTTMLMLGSIGDGSWALPPDASGYQQAIAPDLKYWRTAIIVLTTGEQYFDQEKAAITRLTGIQGKQVDDVWIWDVRSISTPK